MTVPFISFAELVKDYLEPNGYFLEDPQPQDFWNNHDRVIVKKGEYSFPLQFNEKYFYLQIVHLFKQLEIPVPELIQKVFDQHMAVRHSKKLSSEDDSKKDKESGM